MCAFLTSSSSVPPSSSLSQPSFFACRSRQSKSLNTSMHDGETHVVMTIIETQRHRSNVKAYRQFQLSKKTRRLQCVFLFFFVSFKMNCIVQMNNINIMNFSIDENRVTKGKPSTTWAHTWYACVPYNVRYIYWYYQSVEQRHKNTTIQHQIQQYQPEHNDKL